ncbi:MAG: tRNA (adenosine(37)-N6)-threonylcarbamoyltransferase complex ATPase subunit type 1 TsaE [Defluviitaleaceae bacterium]|nr:tRNA (adenosine(37)-N6)-threonylcarbamoyltransferase complex ATPase subunit type 1 TsaE [Defluviitaleaceae bacterium]
MTFETFSQSQTENLACDLAKTAKHGDIFCLIGNLGAGKTAFARGFARGLGIADDITSPTFSIINEYQSGFMPLYHFDVYRIKSISEMEDTGYEEYFYGNGVCLIEWADLIEEIIPSQAVFVNICANIQKGADYREIQVEKISKGKV